MALPPKPCPPQPLGHPIGSNGIDGMPMSIHPKPAPLPAGTLPRGVLSETPSPQQRQAWHAVRRLLAVRLDNLGDVMMTTPALRAIRTSLPGTHITLLASPGAAGLKPYLADVDDVIAYAAPWMKASAPSHALDTVGMIRRLQAGRFDAAVIFTSFSQSPLPAAQLCQLADIGLRLAHCHENPYQLLTDWIADPEPQHAVRHEVQRQLDLVAAIGCRTADTRLRFTLDAASRAAALTRLQILGLDSCSPRPWLVLHPGASAPSRRYPAERWAVLGDELVARLNCTLLWTGNGEEAALIQRIRTGMRKPGTTLANELNLGEFAALLAAAPVLITNNSGPVHLAAALGTPIVDLYALTNPQHTPWGTPHKLLFHPVACGFCYRSVCPELHHGCLRNIAPRSVVDATVALLATGRGLPAESRQSDVCTATQKP